MTQQSTYSNEIVVGQVYQLNSLQQLTKIEQKLQYQKISSSAILILQLDLTKSKEVTKQTH